jgi:hypothetical protein
VKPGYKSTACQDKTEEDALFVISDSELQVPRHDTLLLVISCCVASKFENLSSKIFKDSSKVHYRKTSVTPCDGKKIGQNSSPGAPAPTRFA